MKNNNEDIENLFGDRFSEDEAPVSPKVWDNIQKTLPPDTTKPGAWYAGKSMLYSLLGIGAVAVGLSLLLINTQGKKENGAVEEKIQEIGFVKNNEKSRRESQNNIDSDSNQELIATNTTQSNTKNGQLINPEKETLVIPENNSNVSGTRTNASNNDTIGQKSIANPTVSKTVNPKLDKNILNSKGSINVSQKANNVKGQTQTTNNATSTVQNPTVSKTNQNQNPLVNTNLTNDTGSPTNVIINPISTTTNPVVANPTSNSNGIINNLEKESIPTVKLEDNNKPTNNESNPLVVVTENAPINEKSITSDQSELVDKQNPNSSTNGKTPPIPTASSDTVKNPLMDTLTVKATDTAGVEQVKDVLKTEKIKLPRWSLDVLVSPGFTGAVTRARSDTSSYSSLVDQKNKYDKNQLNFSVGAMLNYAVYPRLNLSVGVVYSGYSEKYNFKNEKIIDTVYLKNYHDTGSTQVLIDSINLIWVNVPYDTLRTKKVPGTVTKNYTSKKIDKYSFLSIPISLSYNLFNKGRFVLTTTAGVKINMLLNGVTYVENADKTGLVEVPHNINKISLSYMASLGFEYKWKEKISLIAQPIINSNLSSVYNKTSFLNQKPYSFGVNAGLRFRL